MSRKISIVVPVYNAGKYIAECIGSIQKQSYSNWELLLVDDGSKDSSGEICSSFAKSDSRIKYIHKENGGVSSARNIGIKESTGDYISFIDSDDYVETDYCEKLLSFKEDLIGLVALGLNKCNDAGEKRIISHRLKSGKQNYSHFCRILVDDGTLSGFTLHSSCATLFETNIIKQKGITFNEKVRFNEDGLFVMEYVFLSQKDVYVNYDLPVYNYRTNFESATQTVDLDSEKYKKSMDIIFEVLSRYPQALDFNQIEKRHATLFINKIIDLAKKGKLTGQIVKQLCKESKIFNVLPVLNYKEMNFVKKMVCFAIRMRLYSLVSIAMNMRYKQ